MEKSILVFFFFFLMWCSPISLTWVKHLNHSPVINTKLPTRVLGLPQSIELIKNQTRDSGKALSESLLQQGWMKTNTVSLAHSPRLGVGSWLFPWGEGNNVPGLQSETWLRCFTYHPSPVVLTAGSMCGPLLLLPALQKWQLGFLAFLYLFVYNLPKLGMHEVIFSPLQFLCILLLEEMLV